MTVIKPIANDGWKSWFDSYDAPSVGRGSSGTVLAIDEDLVIKTYVEDEEGQRDFDREKEIFEILQSGSCSPYIVRFFEEWESGLVLERLRGTLRSHLREKLPPAEHDKTQWIMDACKGLEFLHEKGIMHGDVGCHNFLVDYRGRVKLCDFAGSSRDGETARICYEVRGQHPDYQIGEPTVATEIFGLVSLLEHREVVASNLPFKGFHLLRDLYIACPLPPSNRSIRSQDVSKSKISHF